MADFLLQATLSNLVVATMLACIAWCVQRWGRSASLTNLLWAIVLVKMVTPPLIALPILEVPKVASTSRPPAELSSEIPFESAPGAAVVSDFVLPGPIEPTVGEARPAVDWGAMWSRTSRYGIRAWIAVTALLLTLSASRISRFHWLLKSNSRVHQELTEGLGAGIARQLGLPRIPDIVVTRANIAPFVWWAAGSPIVVVSEQAVQRLSDEDMGNVITHEMAHIRRRDHWLRWLEWIALMGLWWNPVMWWARTQLRISEEIACDELVLEITQPDVHRYANSLLNMAELLTSTAIRPPVVASAINSGGNLEKRLRTMIADKKRRIPSWLRAVICAVAFCIFPIGLVYAQDFEAVERRLGGAVAAGELTLDQAEMMMDALRRSAGAKQTKGQELEARKRRYMGVVEEIKKSVDAGTLTYEDAEKKILAIRKKMFGEQGDQKAALSKRVTDRDLEARKKKYMSIAKEMEAAVKAGKLSKEDAEKKLIQLRMEMFRNPDQKNEAHTHKDADRDLEARKRRYMNIVKEVEAAVEAGKLSKEDAEKKLIQLRMEMFRNPDRKEEARSHKDTDGDLEARKRRYMSIVKEVEAAVEAGKLSKEDAEKKLIQLRMEMFRNPDQKKEARSAKDTDRDLEVRKQRYMSVVKEVEAAVKAGKVSKEDAEKKLIQLRTEMFRNPDQKKEARSAKDTDRDLEARKQRYMSVVKEVEAAVKAGKVSKEDAEKKLIQLRTDMFRNPDQKELTRSAKDTDREMKALESRYNEFAKDIQAAVKSGRLSKEEAEKKLNLYRREQFAGLSGGAREAKQLDARFEHVANRVKVAIESGEMSAEEGRKKLMQIRQEMFEAQSRGGHEAKQLEELFEQVAKRIKAAIESGDMSAEEGREKLMQIRQEMFGGDK